MGNLILNVYYITLIKNGVKLFYFLKIAKMVVLIIKEFYAQIAMNI